MSDFDPVQAAVRDRAIREGNITEIPVAGVPVEVSISGQMTTNGPYFFKVRIGPDGREHMLFAAAHRSLCRQSIPFLKSFLEEFAKELRDSDAEEGR